MNAVSNVIITPQPATEPSLEDVLANPETWKNLYKPAFRLTRSEDVAKEIVQRTALRAWQYRNNCVVKNPRAWLHGIIKKEFFKYYREGKMRAEEYFDEQSHEMLTITGEQQNPAPPSDVDDQISIKQILALNERLSPQRQKILMHMMQGLSEPEIAERMRLSQNTVNSYVEQAREVLRKEIEKPSAIHTDAARKNYCDRILSAASELPESAQYPLCAHIYGIEKRGIAAQLGFSPKSNGRAIRKHFEEVRAELTARAAKEPSGSFDESSIHQVQTNSPRRQFDRAVLIAINELPEAQRYLLCLEMSGQPRKETAQQLGTNVPVLSKHIDQCRNKLEKSVQAAVPSSVLKAVLPENSRR